MAKARMDLNAFVGKLLEEQDRNVLREGIRVLSQALMDTEVAGHRGYGSSLRPSHNVAWTSYQWERRGLLRAYIHAYAVASTDSQAPFVSSAIGPELDMLNTSAIADSVAGCARDRRSRATPRRTPGNALSERLAADNKIVLASGIEWSGGGLTFRNPAP